MRHAALFLSLAASLGAAAMAAAPLASLKKAPDFTLSSAEGKTHSLADFRGKFVVLEWWNYQCPLVKKHYDSGNMQKLQKEWTEKGVVWLAINSSAPGKQGHVAAAYATEVMKKHEAKPTAVLLDHNGKVGRAFEAKVTPHMFVINPNGEIIYNGAIDSIPGSNKADIARAENYVSKALTEAKAGKAVSTPLTQPYGCSVKY